MFAAACWGAVFARCGLSRGRARRHDHLLAPIRVLVHRGYSETRRHRYSALALDGRVATLSPFRDAIVARAFALLAPLSHCPVARISLRVKTLLGLVVPVSATFKCRVKEVKQYLVAHGPMSMRGRDYRSLRILFRGKSLHDDKLLVECGMHGGETHTIRVLFGLRGGGGGKNPTDADAAAAGNGESENDHFDALPSAAALAEAALAASMSAAAAGASLHNCVLVFRFHFAACIARVVLEMTRLAQRHRVSPLAGP